MENEMEELIAVKRVFDIEVHGANKKDAVDGYKHNYYRYHGTGNRIRIEKVDVLNPASRGTNGLYRLTVAIFD